MLSQIGRICAGVISVTWASSVGNAVGSASWKAGLQHAPQPRLPANLGPVGIVQRDQDAGHDAFPVRHDDLMAERKCSAPWCGKPTRLWQSCGCGRCQLPLWKHRRYGLFSTL